MSNIHKNRENILDPVDLLHGPLSSTILLEVSSFPALDYFKAKLRHYRTSPINAPSIPLLKHKDSLSCYHYHSKKNLTVILQYHETHNQ